MPKYVIEREIAGGGRLSHEQLQAISQKPCGVLSNLGPQIQWVESYVMDDRVLLRLHRGQRGTGSRTRPAGRFSREPDFRRPRDYRSDHCRADPLATVAAGLRPVHFHASLIAPR